MEALHTATLPKPPWLRVKAPSGKTYQNLKQLLQKQHLHTVCASATCPNMGECWSQGTATFMILGNLCTRACRFCDVKSSKKPNPVDLNEPMRLVQAVLDMNLKHVVITSVARDDLIDGGASQFVRCLLALYAQKKNLTTEVLVPDFLGKRESIESVIAARPHIFNHNLETVRRLTPKIRSKAQYDRSLQVLSTAKSIDPFVRIKSGLMLGLGETDEEVLCAMADLRKAGCDLLTLGQYLRPSALHHPVERYVAPEQFASFKKHADSLGFLYTESGPLVRSSYHADRGLLPN